MKRTVYFKNGVIICASSQKALKRAIAIFRAVDGRIPYRFSNHLIEVLRLSDRRGWASDQAQHAPGHTDSSGERCEIQARRSARMSAAKSLQTALPG